jgi:hypothetical protein
MFWLFPVTNSTTGTSRSTPSSPRTVQTPSSEDVSEVMAPAGSDMQMLPPTVAAFQILNDARSDRQHSSKSGAAIQSGGATKASSSAIVQVAAIRRPSSLTVRAGQAIARRSSRRRRCTCGSEKSQVPPASQLSPSVHAVAPPSTSGAPRTSVTVFRFIVIPRLDCDLRQDADAAT